MLKNNKKKCELIKIDHSYFGNIIGSKKVNYIIFEQKKFIFMENSSDTNNTGVTPPQKKVKVNLWSCCMNSDQNSRGCQKKTIRNFRWIYNP